MFRLHSVSQRPNLRHWAEPLGGAESLLEAVSFKKATENVVRGRVANARWVHTVGAATLKPREAKVVRTVTRLMNETNTPPTPKRINRRIESRRRQQCVFGYYSLPSRLIVLTFIADTIA